MNSHGGPAMKLAAFVLSVMILASAGAGRPPEKPHKLADALLAGLGSTREPGEGVLVLRDGKVVYLGTRGVAELQGLRPIDGRTSFRLASVTKQFTAAAVMLLVRDELVEDVPFDHIFVSIAQLAAPGGAGGDRSGGENPEASVRVLPLLP